MKSSNPYVDSIMKPCVPKIKRSCLCVFDREENFETGEREWQFIDQLEIYTIDVRNISFGT